MDDERLAAAAYAKALAVFLNGDAIPEPDPRGEPVVDDSFLLLFNGAPRADGLHCCPCQEYGEALAGRGSTPPTRADRSPAERTRATAAGSTVRMRVPRRRSS